MKESKPQDFSHHKLMEEVREVIKIIYFNRYVTETLYDLSNEVRSNRDQNGFKAIDGRRIFLIKLNTCYISYAFQENKVQELLDKLYQLNQIDVPKKRGDVINMQEKERHDGCTCCDNLDKMGLVTLHNIMNQMEG